MRYVYETAHSHLLNKIITCYNKLIEQRHLMKTSSMPSKYGIQEQNGRNDQWALSSPFCPHILKQKDVCITLLIVSKSNQGQSDDTTSAGGVWQGNEIWSCSRSHFCCWAEEIILLFLSVLLHCYIRRGQAAKYTLLSTTLLLWNVCVCGMRKRVKNTHTNTYIYIFNH